VTGPLASLPDVVLGPLTSRSEEDWYRAPSGKWCAAQIVEHLAISVDASSGKFEERRAREPMVRRPRTLFQRLAYLLIMRIGWIPRLFNAPAATRPSGHPDSAAVAARLREGVARFERLAALLLPARGNDLFVRHPVLGDLNLGEWLHFHDWHFRHHAKQVRERLAAR